MPKFSKFKILCLLVLMSLLLYNSSVSRKGTYYGLVLWYQSVIPSLFPFMVLTTLLSNIVNGAGFIYIIFIGFLCGFPMGAKTAADLYKQGRISLKECQLAAGFCNLPSPMFLIGYAGLKWELLAIYLTAACILLTGFFYIKSTAKNSPPDFITAPVSIHTDNSHSAILNFETSVLSCCFILLKIGIYLVLFSIAAAFLQTFTWIPPAISLYLTCLLELTTGTNATLISQTLQIPANIIISATCTFGGLCGAAQTKSVMTDVPFSLPVYLLCKTFHASIVIVLLLYII